MLSGARGLECYFLSSFGGNEGRSGAQAAGDRPPEASAAMEVREALTAEGMSPE